MKLNDLKDLQKLLQLCQKMGVEAMEVDGIKFNLRAPVAKATRAAFNRAADAVVKDMFPEANMAVPAYNPAQGLVGADNIKSDTLTEEELLFYSARNEMTGEKQGT